MAASVRGGAHSEEDVLECTLKLEDNEECRETSFHVRQGADNRWKEHEKE